ncbi:DUF1643 domain-containing protein [Endozoicomonas sp. G2_2]|uniref:DUF1643 domain-containing protein n=1 Tax=Endozoicomonas sp. G2_2 TaxID=2821092 RepID=UPI001ADBF107|nr:DUF1643 domain-containing protein [Endozoicomonas sp. G2_2]
MDILAAANFSPDRRHRYTLCRPISMFGDRPLVSCGYNPSVAAEARNDPTITREVTLAEMLDCSMLIKVNTFAAVSPYPDDLAVMSDPVGTHNDEAIQAAVRYCREHDGILLACWGTPKGKAATRRLAAQRFREVAALTNHWTALRVTKEGHPEHPLYLPGGLVPSPWNAQGKAYMPT